MLHSGGSGGKLCAWKCVEKCVSFCGSNPWCDSQLFLPTVWRPHVGTIIMQSFESSIERSTRGITIWKRRQRWRCRVTQESQLMLSGLPLVLTWFGDICRFGCPHIQLTRFEGCKLKSKRKRRPESRRREEDCTLNKGKHETNSLN